MFGIVRYVRPKAVDDTAIVPVSTENNVVVGHVAAQRFEDVAKRSMKEFAPELSKLGIVTVLPISFQKRQFIRSDVSNTLRTNILILTFGDRQEADQGCDGTGDSCWGENCEEDCNWRVDV